jgi:hypothetical protein
MTFFPIHIERSAKGPQRGTDALTKLIQRLRETISQERRASAADELDKNSERMKHISDVNWNSIL